VIWVCRPDSEAQGTSSVVRVGLGEQGSCRRIFPLPFIIGLRASPSVRYSASIQWVFGRFELLETCTEDISRQNGLFWSRDMVCRPGKAGAECAETAIEGQ
jgi:hypothetical protein